MVFQEPITALNPVYPAGESDGRGLSAPPWEAERKVAGGRAAARAFSAGQGGNPGAGATAAPVSPSIVRRSAAKGDDRNGLDVRAGPDHRRRADDGARRHHSGTGPTSIEGTAARTRHGGDAHHPRSRGGCPHGRPHTRDVCGRGGRVRIGARDLQPAVPPLYPRASCAACPAVLDRVPDWAPVPERRGRGWE